MKHYGTAACDRAGDVENDSRHGSAGSARTRSWRIAAFVQCSPDIRRYTQGPFPRSAVRGVLQRFIRIPRAKCDADLDKLSRHHDVPPADCHGKEWLFLSRSEVLGAPVHVSGQNLVFGPGDSKEPTQSKAYRRLGREKTDKARSWLTGAIGMNTNWPRSRSRQEGQSFMRSHTITMSDLRSGFYAR